MSDHLLTSRGDRVAYDLRGSGPALVFIAGAGPYRAIDPWATTTAEAAARQGITTVVYDRLGRGESRVGGRIDLDRELDAALLQAAGGSAVLCGHSSRRLHRRREPGATQKRMPGAGHTWEPAPMADELVEFVKATG